MALVYFSCLLAIKLDDDCRVLLIQTELSKIIWFREVVIHGCNDAIVGLWFNRILAIALNTVF